MDRRDWRQGLKNESIEFNRKRRDVNQCLRFLLKLRETFIQQVDKRIDAPEFGITSDDIAISCVLKGV